MGGYTLGINNKWVTNPVDNAPEVPYKERGPKSLRKFANIRCIEAKEAKRGEAKRSKMERKGSTFKFQD